MEPIARQVSSTAPILLSVAGVCLLLASVLYSLALQPAFVASLAPPEGSYTDEVLRHFGERLGLVGLCLILFGVASYVARSHLQAFLVAALGSMKQFLLLLVWGFSHWARSSGWAHLGVLAAILLGAMAVRIHYLGQPIRYDEAFTFNEFVSRPLYVGLSYYPLPNNHLLHTLLVHLSAFFFGSEPWAIRLPAFVGGVLLVPATYVLTRYLYGPSAAILAAALVAFSGVLLDYSTNARGYSLLVLASVTLFALAAVFVRTRNPAALLLATVVAALGFYAVPTMLYAYGSALLWVAISAHPRGQLLRHLAVSSALLALLVFALYVPPIVVSGPDSLVANRFVAPLPWESFVQGLIALPGSVWRHWNTAVPLPLALLLLLAFILDQIAGKKQRGVRMPLFLPILVVCSTVLLVQRVIPFERVWLVFAPLYFAAACGGLVWLLRGVEHRRLTSGRASVAIAGVLAFVLLAHVLLVGPVPYADRDQLFEPGESIALLLKDRLGESDAVLVLHSTGVPQLQYYFREYGLTSGLLVEEVAAQERAFVVYGGDSGSLLEHLAEGGVSQADWDPPTLLATYETVEVYEVRRRETRRGA